jgi:HAD superfamily hydrolase (TIGR01509 family)
MDSLIFDMDGVIVDSELYWRRREGFFLRSLVPSWSDADQDRIIGLSVGDTHRLLTTEYSLQLTREEFLEVYHPMARRIYGHEVSLLEGFSELLSALNEEGVPVALASSSPRSWIDMVLDRFDLRGRFVAVVSAEELQGEGKPSPAIYLLTAEKLGVDPRRCIDIEDSRNGVRSAKRAGMFGIGLRNGFNDDQDLSQADMIVDSLTKLDYSTLRLLLKREARATP